MLIKSPTSFTKHDTCEIRSQYHGGGFLICIYSALMTVLCFGMDGTDVVCFQLFLFYSESVSDSNIQYIWRDYSSIRTSHCVTERSPVEKYLFQRRRRFAPVCASCRRASVCGGGVKFAYSCIPKSKTRMKVQITAKSMGQMY